MIARVGSPTAIQQAAIRRLQQNHGASAAVALSLTQV
jgi:hypothetical protein